ncbi:MAG: aldolase [Candidatus Pacearchaeota archaeon]
MKIRLNKIMKNGKALYLAYDQGIEHGPESDFNDKSVDPKEIIKIAEKGKFQGVVLHKGIAEKYKDEIKKSKVPLILKLNGKTKLYKGDPYSPPLGTVEEAVNLGASAVGYTIYPGSKYEGKMFKEFEIIEKDAHAKGLPVITWIYPRGENIKNETSREMMAYSARIALELGADIVKMKYGGNLKDLKWAVRSAGKTKVVISGGVKKSNKEFLKQVREIMSSGAIGLAVGRNIWQSKDPLDITNKIKKIIFYK